MQEPARTRSCSSVHVSSVVDLGSGEPDKEGAVDTEWRKGGAGGLRRRSGASGCRRFAAHLDCRLASKQRARSPNERHVHAQAAVDARASQADVHAVRDGGPGGVLCGAVKADLRGARRRRRAADRRASARMRIQLRGVQAPPKAAVPACTDRHSGPGNERQAPRAPGCQRERGQVQQEAGRVPCRSRPGRGR